MQITSERKYLRYLEERTKRPDMVVTGGREGREEKAGIEAMRMKEETRQLSECGNRGLWVFQAGRVESALDFASIRFSGN